MMTRMTWLSRHQLAKSGLQMMLLLSSGFLVSVFTRKAKSSFIWWWSSFWSWLMCWALQAAPLKSQSLGQRLELPATTNNKTSTIVFLIKSLCSFPRKYFLNSCISTLECGICWAPQALLCTRDPPLQNCICVATMSSNAGMQIWIRISDRSMQTLTTSQWLLYLMLDHVYFLSGSGIENSDVFISG